MRLSDIILSQPLKTKNILSCGKNDYTYGDIYDSANEICKLISNNTSTRCNISIMLPNVPEYIFAYFGILLSGNIIVPIYHNSSVYEVINAINTYDIAVIITDSTVKRDLTDEDKKISHKLCVIDGYTLQYEIIGDKSRECPKTKAQDDVAIMLGTSGSTSNPKRVMLTDKQIIENAKAIIKSLDYNKDDVFLVISSLTFSAANTAQLIVPLFLSAKIVLYDSVVHPAKVIQSIKKYGVTTTSVVPSLLKLLAKYDFDSDDTKTLRMLCSSGSIASPENIIDIKKKLPYTEISNNYGMTEAAPRISRQRHAELNPKSVGKPLENVQVKIIDPDGKDVPVNTQGQIVVQSPSLMSGYYANPNETARTIRNGWLMTGDIGAIDEEGNLYVYGRIKNIIITNGINIYPEEIEEVLLSNPHITEAMVKSFESPIYGEVPAAYVVMDGRLSETDVIDYCRKYLQEIKVPKHIFFVTELEKTGSGKIRRV